jgi:hypothetical protein
MAERTDGGTTRVIRFDECGDPEVLKLEDVTWRIRENQLTILAEFR